MRFVSSSARDQRGRLVSAAQIVYHAGLNSPFCLHTCHFIRGKFVDSEAVESDFFSQLAIRPVRLWDESVANQLWKYVGQKAGLILKVQCVKFSNLFRALLDGLPEEMAGQDACQLGACISMYIFICNNEYYYIL